MDPHELMDAQSPLVQARDGLSPHLTEEWHENTPVPAPPAEWFQVVHYTSPLGELPAYLSHGPARQRPAVLWLPGHFQAGLHASLWQETDQPTTPKVEHFLQAEVRLMYPSLRGGNTNPGQIESFLGEVEDVLAAGLYLAQHPHVDPQQIYLVGHSTGATLALLVAETGTRLFRSIIALGPRHDAATYGQHAVTYDVENAAEAAARAPERWLAGVQVPTWILEGDHRSNLRSLERMAAAPHPALVHYQVVPGADHFSLVQPIGALLAHQLAHASPVEFSATAALFAAPPG